ncbi:MAG: FHA domain-containing serine/threonine-protein kinase [Pseudomonadota bacterium]
MDKHKAFTGAHQHYRIESILGRGAMGVVYKGISLETEESVAIKTLRQDLLSGSERVSVMDRFKREASISMEMKHPNIVRVLDSGQEDEDVFLAMELIQGKELKDLMGEADPIPLDSVVKIMEQLLDALGHAHKQGVVHRDIKPANIMVQDDLSIKVTDFGIARMESSEMTHAGTILGTPAFMSPEQIIGGPVDGRADIFSAGIVLYQLLTGQKPFTGQLTSIMYKILNETPPAPSLRNARVPAAFDGVVMKAIAKDRDERFDDTEAFSKALRDAWEQARQELFSADEDETIIADFDDTVAETESPAPTADPGDRLKELGARTEELLRQSVEKGATPRHLASLKKLFQEYRDLWEGDAGRDPGTASVIRMDRDRFGEMALGRLKDIIISEAPVPGKRPAPGDRNDWMRCIDLFKMLGEAVIHLGGDDQASSLAAAVRSELLRAAMLYATSINQQLLSPDHIELNLISADFMRLDILQWGLEELGGDDEVRQMQINIGMFAGQVLQRVNVSIRDFILSRELLARFDVANLLIYIDELIVIAKRIIEIPPEGAAPGGDARPDVIGRGIIPEFIENAGKLVKIFVEELKEEVTAQEVNISAFRSKLKQLGRLYQFSVLFDDKSCRSPLHELTGGVYSSIEELTEVIKDLLHAAHGEPAGEQRADMLQELLTVIYELAEELGWLGFCQGLMTDLRNRFLAGAPGKAESPGDSRNKTTLSGGEPATLEVSPDSKHQGPPPPRAKLTCLDDSFFPGNKKGLEVQLTGSELIIGRGSDSGVIIESDQISRQHARIYPEGDTWGVEDLKSANGVRVNDGRITSAVLIHGDIISFGPIPFRYEIVAPEIPDHDPEMTTFANLDEPAEEVTLMYSDVRSSKAMMEALEKEDKREAGPSGGIEKEDAAVPSPRARMEAPARRRAAAFGRILLHLFILVVVFGMGAGGYHYYQNTYKVEKAREQIIRQHSSALKQFSDDFETYGRFDKKSLLKEVNTLASLLIKIDGEIKNHPRINELKAIEATALFMLLERRVRFLLEEKRAQEAFSLIDRAKKRMDSALSNGEIALDDGSKTLAEIANLMELLRVVCRYKLFQQKYADPYDTGREKNTTEVMADVLEARKWKQDFIVLKKENSMALSVKFRYLDGMVSNVDEYGIALVNRWFHYLSSKDNP